MASHSRVLRRRALRIEQHPQHPLYLFALTGEELLHIADISRVSRNDAGKLIGYQRPEVKRHVDDIVEYLNGDELIFPNSLILALSSRVTFVRSRGPQVEDTVVTAGTLEVPLPQDGELRPAWIVDGQQRALAISRSRRRDLRVPVNAFVADEVDLQRDQFLRVNNTQPLPRGLITELLPEVSTSLPARLAPRKIPAALCDLLQHDPESPFHGLIRQASATGDARRTAVITDTSVVRMIEESLSSPSGCLFPHRNLATGETDFDTIRALLFTYWTAVKETFPDAWGKPPTRSRLMHGIGIRSMGRLMDKIMTVVSPTAPDAVAAAKDELEAIVPICRWTSGRWEQLDNLRWNELQNVPRHIGALSNLIIRTYVHQRAAAA